MKNYNKLNFFYLLPIFCIGLIISLNNCKNVQGTVTDIDGNVYKTVKIGSQVWLVENLKTLRFRNGDSIPLVTDSVEWRELSTPAYCNYNNDTTNVKTYGRLYNWFAINDFRGIAPEGWHVPSPEELKLLTDFLGGDFMAGGKMKEAGNEHWLAPNTGATNESGFLALPGGYRFTNDSAHHPIGGTFHTLGTNGYWWNTTESYQIYSWSNMVHFRFADIIRDYTNKTYGFSVRCVKD